MKRMLFVVLNLLVVMAMLVPVAFAGWPPPNTYSDVETVIELEKWGFPETATVGDSGTGFVQTTVTVDWLNVAYFPGLIEGSASYDNWSDVYVDGAWYDGVKLNGGSYEYAKGLLVDNGDGTLSAVIPVNWSATDPGTITFYMFGDTYAFSNIAKLKGCKWVWVDGDTDYDWAELLWAILVRARSDWKPVGEHIVWNGLPSDAWWADLYRLELDGKFTKVPDLHPSSQLPSPVHGDLMIHGGLPCTYVMRVCRQDGSCYPQKQFTVVWTGSNGLNEYWYNSLPPASPTAIAQINW